GRFLRGKDGGAGNDPDSESRKASGTNGNTGDAVGSLQADANKSHRHISGVPTDNGRNVYGQANVGNRASLSYNGVVSPYSPYTNYEGASDSRPKNINVNYMIKY
ncbi:MAG: tail fiber protein, partial [Planctomycetota bacterium]